MTTVTLHPTHTPTETILKAATRTGTVTDARGRVLTLRQPGALQQFRLVEALGQTADNPTYLRLVMPLIWVTAIDGDPVSAPTTKREVEALIQRLEEDGIQAISKGLSELIGEGVTKEAVEKKPDSRD